MSFGKMGARGGFGSAGVLGGAGNTPGFVNFTGSNLSSWQTSLAGGSNSRLVALGDSTTAGAFSDGTVNGTVANAYPTVMAQNLTTAGFLTKSDSFFCDLNMTSQGDSYTTHDNRITQGAGWTPTTVSMAGKTWFNNSTTNTLSFAPGSNQFDKLDVLTILGNSAFNVNFDGGSNTSVGGAGSGLRFDTVTGSLSTHTVNMTRTSGSDQLIGGIAYNSAVKQTNVLNIGAFGYRTADWNVTTNPWSALNAAVFLSGNLYIVSLGINDMVQAVALATSQSNLQAIITALLAKGSVILMGPNPVNPAQANAPAATQLAFRSMVAALAISNGIPFIDAYSLFGGSYAAAVAASLLGDNNHPNQAGYQVIASACAKAVKPGFRSMAPSP